MPTELNTIEDAIAMREVLIKKIEQLRQEAVRCEYEVSYLNGAIYAFQAANKGQ